ncbi:hypothetical protein FBU59_001151 [Linderina macrospora]|uniref:Uncharacterized protein n=1 Tax=Linderina macrospora TaxID=4868 RepID=A0ACC1JEM4_9FUNG|nr:hypothetical protein FBU59_001151 [Linderina macrospora]
MIHSTKSARTSLAKPFKSPRKLPVTPAKEPATECQTPPVSSAKKKRRLSPPLTSTPKTPTRTPRRALRTPQTGNTSLRSVLSKSPMAPRFTIHDKETQRLLQEKARLQKELLETREQVAMLERAHLLVTKGDAETVDGLVRKWQAACAAASEDLFEVLRPMMEAQRQTDALSAEAATAPNSEEDIDVAYMLRRLGIDPDLF